MTEARASAMMDMRRKVVTERMSTRRYLRKLVSIVLAALAASVMGVVLASPALSERGANMKRIVMLATLAGRRLAAEGGPLIGSRYAKVLVLSATLTAAMVVGLLAFATSARADVDCDGIFCLEKTATPDPATVGEPLTYTIRGYCIPETNCG